MKYFYLLTLFCFIITNTNSQTPQALAQSWYQECFCEVDNQKVLKETHAIARAVHTVLKTKLFQAERLMQRAVIDNELKTSEEYNQRIIESLPENISTALAYIHGYLEQMGKQSRSQEEFLESIKKFYEECLKFFPIPAKL